MRQEGVDVCVIFAGPPWDGDPAVTTRRFLAPLAPGVVGVGNSAGRRWNSKVL